MNVSLYGRCVAVVRALCLAGMMLGCRSESDVNGPRPAGEQEERVVKRVPKIDQDRDVQATAKSESAAAEVAKADDPQAVAALDAAGAVETDKAGVVIGLALTGRDVKNDVLRNLEGTPHVKTLDLSRSDISDEGLQYVGKLEDLEYLDLNECSWIDDGGMKHVRRLTKLRELRLWFTRVGDAGVAELSVLTRLQRLNLDKTRITDEGLANLKPLVNLVSLRLSSNDITDQGLQHLTGLSKLKKLTVAFCTGVTDEGIAALKQAVPTLQTVEK